MSNIDWPAIVQAFRDGGYSNKKEFYKSELFRRLCGGTRPPMYQFYEQLTGVRNGRWELHLHLPPSIMKGGGQPGRTTILRTVFLVLRHRQKIADRFNRTPYCADIYWPLARPTCSGG